VVPRRSSKRSEFRSVEELKRTLFPNAYEAEKSAQMPPEEVGQLMATRILKDARKNLRKASE
jgi:hypothetical protein